MNGYWFIVTSYLSSFCDVEKNLDKSDGVSVESLLFTKTDRQKKWTLTKKVDLNSKFGVETFLIGTITTEQ